MNITQGIYSFFITVIFAAFFITNAQQQINPSKLRSDVVSKENASPLAEYITPNILQISDVSFSAGNKILNSPATKSFFSFSNKNFVSYFSELRILSVLFRKFLLNGQLRC